MIFVSIYLLVLVVVFQLILSFSFVLVLQYFFCFGFILPSAALRGGARGVATPGLTVLGEENFS